MTTLFTVREVARIVNLGESRLRYWAQTGFINPSGRKGGHRAYTFGDLIEIKAAKELLDARVPLRRVRTNLAALRKAMPDAPNPLSMLRVCSNGDELVVDDGTATVEPISGQLVLDFDTEGLGQQVAEVLQLVPAARKAIPQSKPGGPADALEQLQGADDDAENDDLQNAYTCFLRGCSLDEAAGGESQALEAYQRAVELDPSLAAAHTNMGNLHYRLGNRSAALHSYETAIALDPDQPEALYNLGNIYEEEGDLDMAIAEYRRALRSLPDFSDAHFNLALALEEVGGHRQASSHWQRFLDLTPETSETQGWRELACNYLQQG